MFEIKFTTLPDNDRILHKALIKQILEYVLLDDSLIKLAKFSWKSLVKV